MLAVRMMAVLLSLTCLACGCRTDRKAPAKHAEPGKPAPAGKPEPLREKGPVPQTSTKTTTIPDGHPAISYIGEKPILSITPGQELDISIHGSDLFQSELAWSVEVAGTIPAMRGRDYILKTYGDYRADPTVSLGNAMIVLSSNYTAQLHDKDSIVIDANIMQVDAEKVRKTAANLREFEAVVTSTLAEKDNESFKKSLPEITGMKESLLGNISAQSLMSLDNVRSSFEGFKDTPDEHELSATRVKLRTIAQRLDDTEQALSQEATRFPNVTSGTGSFQVYTVDTYRQKFQNTTFEMFEIKAYPLPEAMIAEILGQKVADHYYVVALSLKNSSTQDRIVNTGLINAWGKALVYPADDTRPVFSKPVEVSPDSLQQVYSAVAGSKWNTGREWIFRSLEFAGTLGTAIATGFKGTPDLIKALGVYTGVGIPSLQKLWPDQVPNYLANIVNFGMPELVKVPHGSSQGFQLLFFSKDSLDAMIPDPSQFREKSFRSDKPLLPPKTYVIYLSFDTLIVPYDLATESTSGNTLAITTKPVSATGSVGGTASFSVTATGSGQLVYQWYDNNAILPQDANHIGTKTATLTINNLVPADNGSYKVTINDSTGASLTSADVSLTVNPTVTIAPANPTLTHGQDLTLTATAQGLTSPTYKWQYNGKDLREGPRINGATANPLVVHTLTPADEGTYNVTATDQNGKTSATASTTLKVQ